MSACFCCGVLLGIIGVKVKLNPIMTVMTVMLN